MRIWLTAPIVIGILWWFAFKFPRIFLMEAMESQRRIVADYEAENCRRPGSCDSDMAKAKDHLAKLEARLT